MEDQGHADRRHARARRQGGPGGLQAPQGRHPPLDRAQAGAWQIRVGSDAFFRDERWRDLYGFGSEDEVGDEAWQARVHSEDLGRIKANLREGLAGPRASWIQEFRIQHPTLGERWIEDHVQVHRDGAGRPQTVNGLSLDVSDRKRAHEQIHLLMREVNHRSKNLLAVVQAVARQTAATTEPQDFAKSFGKRIASLAASHDLLVKNAWQGIDLDELVRSQLAHFAGLVGSRVILSGPSLHVTAAAAQAIGMALHELATNAGKYGALSNDAGRVRIGWELSGDGEERRVRMRWSEEGGPPVSPPERRGFGHTVLMDMAEMSLFATVRLDYAPEGVTWEFEAPAERVLEEGIPAPARLASMTAQDRVA